MEYAISWTSHFFIFCTDFHLFVQSPFRCICMRESQLCNAHLNAAWLCLKMGTNSLVHQTQRMFSQCLLKDWPYPLPGRHHQEVILYRWLKTAFKHILPWTQAFTLVIKVPLRNMQHKSHISHKDLVEFYFHTLACFFSICQYFRVCW